MIENLKNINDRNTKLVRFSEDDLDQLYLRVFNSPDGELVMQDMANRSYDSQTTLAESSAETEFNEGMRSLYMSIVSRLQGAIAPKPKEESNG